MKRELFSGFLVISLLISTLGLAFSIQPVKARALLKFRVGDQIRTTSSLDVMFDTGEGYALIDTVPEGTLGQIADGPVDARGIVLWDVEYNTGVRGWSAEDWLELRAIHIRYDGSVDPPTAPISTSDRTTYTFTTDIVDYLAVERNDILIDGAGYALQTPEDYGSAGVNLWQVSNVTIMNMEIEGFEYGIDVRDSYGNNITKNNIQSYTGIGLSYSGYNIIYGNNITKCFCGIQIGSSSDNNISGNNILDNEFGIEIGISTGLENCYRNIITGNTIAVNSVYGIRDGGRSWGSSIVGNIITNNGWGSFRYGDFNGWGIELNGFSNNRIAENYIANNWGGIRLGWESSDNFFYHNDFVENNAQQVERNLNVLSDVWDDGYPSGGNYWSDYTGVDANGDGIGDTPHVLDVNNQDRYPLMNPWTPTPPAPNFSIVASPTSLPIQQGNSGSSTITITSTNGFNQPVQLTASGVPSAVTTTLNPQQVTPPSGGSTTSTLTVSVGTTATVGSYTLTVTGTSGALTHSAYISLEIKAPLSTLFHQYWPSGLELSVGEMIDESTVKFAGVVSSPNGGLVKLEVELRRLTEYDGQFDETKEGLKESQFVESGSTAVIAVEGLWRGSYHWRARTIDEHETRSEWSDFGNNDIKEPDFTVCNKFKVTYPEGWMNLQLFVPSAYSPVGYLDKVKFGLFNKRDMWYKITASRRVPGGFWEDITDQIWKVPYVGPYSSAGESLLYSPIDGEEIKIELKNVFGLDPVLTGYLIVDLAARWSLGLCLPPNALSLLSNDRWVQLKAELTEFFNNRIAQRLSEFTFWSLEKFLVAGFKAMAEYRPLLSSILIDMGLPIAKAAKLVNVVINIADKAFFLYDFVNAAIVSKDLWASMISESQEENVILAVEERLTTTVAPNLILTEGLHVTPEGTYLQGDKINAHFAVKNVGLLPINLHVLTVGGRTEEGYVQDFSFKTGVTISPGGICSYEGELPLLWEGRNSFFVAAQMEDGEWITNVPTEAGLANTLYVDVEPVYIVVAGYLGSPGELRVYDSQGRITGLVAGETRCEIPHSFYYDNMITIFSPEDDLTYCVVGTENGTYDLEIVRSDHGEVTTFAAKDIATSPSTIHEFSFDWTALSQDREGVIVQVDSNGDGMFEHTFTSDSELTQSEYILATDTIPPETQLNVGAPRLVVNDVTHLTSATPIELTAEDDLGGSGVASTAYRIRNATYNSDWISGMQPFCLVGLSDGTYQIDYNSTDNAGNVEPTNTASVILDNTPPATNMTIGDPKYVSTRTYATRDTPFTLASTESGSEVASTFYRIWNNTYTSGWLTYSNSFCMTSLTDGNYTISYYSIDNVGNRETEHTANITLFSWTYVFVDSYGRGTVLQICTQYKLFQFITKSKDFGVKYDSRMVVLKNAIAICYTDSKMSLAAAALVGKTSFCAAAAWDKQANKTYSLLARACVE